MRGATIKLGPCPTPVGISSALPRACDARRNGKSALASPLAKERGARNNAGLREIFKELPKHMQ